MTVRVHLDGVGLSIGVLGPLEVYADGVAVPLPGGRPRAVLAALLLARPAVLGVDRLAGLLMPGVTPGEGRNAAQTYVARLRRALGPTPGSCAPARRAMSSTFRPAPSTPTGSARW